MNRLWPRRVWLTRQAALLATLSAPRFLAFRRGTRVLSRPTCAHRQRQGPGTADRLDLDPLTALVRRAVEVARGAGATYADARLTRIVQHTYSLGGVGSFDADTEDTGIGVRALVGGAWGFAASADWDPDVVVRLAQDAVAQAREASQGPPRPVELGTIPVVTGSWVTPIAIDPFAIPIEEKLAAIVDWKTHATRLGCPLQFDGTDSGLHFTREERVLATSDGSLVTQTLYQSGGRVSCVLPGRDRDGPSRNVPGITLAGEGWERLGTALPAQLEPLRDQLLAQDVLDHHARPVDVGQYTLVCDGATMAAVLERTLGVATQLDRALGYEANATGTSFLDQPLAMLGTYHVAAPLVTVTANRSAPTQLATVHWDNDGVAPQPFTLINDGVLVDYQTTREQAAWLAPYYQRQGKPVQSHGCAAAWDAHYLTMQHPPNLAVTPSPAATRVEDLIADVPEGIWIEGGYVTTDAQARTGVLWPWIPGQMRQIRRGQLGPKLVGGAIRFETADLWRRVVALGGAQTTGDLAISGFGQINAAFVKGEPPQLTSYTTRAVAATITHQAVIDPTRRA